MSVLVFTIQTIPDIDGARRLYDLHGLSEEDVAKALFHMRRQQFNQETLAQPLQRIISISAVLAIGDHFKLWSLGDENSSEQDLLQRFYAGLEKYKPQVVCWNGDVLELPVIHYRSLLYPINAQHYWQQTEQDRPVLHQGTLNLMAELASHSPTAAASLHDIASLCGLPGRLQATPQQLWQQWLAGEISAIRHDGEIDALNTYLLFLNWQRNRGKLDSTQYQQQCAHVRAQLKNSSQSHLIEFENNWIEI